MYFNCLNCGFPNEYQILCPECQQKCYSKKLFYTALKVWKRIVCMHSKCFVCGRNKLKMVAVRYPLPNDLFKYHVLNGRCVCSDCKKRKLPKPTSTDYSPFQ